MKTLTFKSDDHWLAVYEALGQYVQNTEEVEEELSDTDKAKLAAAQEVLADMDLDLMALADEPVGDELYPESGDPGSYAAPLPANNTDGEERN